MGSPTRRDFCRHACHAVSLAGFGALLEGCGGSPTAPSAPMMPTISASVVNGVVSITIDASSPLASVGSGAIVQSSSASYLVARTAQTTFTALNPFCTHDGCTVSGFQNLTFVCPCHGSQFDSNGAVVKGPAELPLKRYTTQFANNVLTIVP